MNNHETNLKPALNYSIIGVDCPNWITNVVSHGTAELMFPVSIPMSSILEAFNDILKAGYIENFQWNTGGEESDHNVSLILTDYEHYKIVLRELTSSWDLCPIASAYTPSRKELGI